ncbi:MAG: TolC family protein, partial [Deltaproteobacteria bacterium]|nr:TolC family protein [Deltaproteobacteria bacterium]
MERSREALPGSGGARRGRRLAREGCRPLSLAAWLLWLVALLLPAAPVAAADPALKKLVRMTLAQALTHLDAGPAGAMARADLDRYLALQRRAFWAFLHELDLTTAFGYAPTCSEKPPGDTGLCAENVDVLDPSIYRPTFDLRGETTILLYTFGKMSSAKDQARAGRDAAMHQADLERAKLVEQIGRAYYGILLGDALVDLVTDARSRLEREMARVRKKLSKLKGSWEDESWDDDQGGGPDEPGDGAADSDEIEEEELRLARVGGYLAEARALEAQARAGMHTAREGLRIGVGMPPDTLVLPAEQELTAVLDTIPPLAKMQELARSHNALLGAAQAGVDAARAELSRAQADLWPSFVLRAGVRANLTAADCLVDPAQPEICRDAQTGYPYGFLALSWNLDYPELLTRQSEAKAKLARMTAQRDGARLLVEAAVSSAWYQVQQRLEVLGARSDAEGWARRRRTTMASRCGGLEVLDDGQERSPRCNEEQLASALRSWLETKAA